jgi:hypothetical protein
MSVRAIVEFNIDQNKANQLKDKITQLEEFDFTKDEKKLMFKMIGFDLFTVSELKCIGILLLVRELYEKQN